MQRRPSKKTRGPNADEKRFQRWVKEQPCIVCLTPGPSIVDHVRGSTYKLKHDLVTVLLGHYYVIPLCPACDRHKTHGSHKLFESTFGVSQRSLWLRLLDRYQGAIPGDVVAAIAADTGEVTPM